MTMAYPNQKIINYLLTLVCTIVINSNQIVWTCPPPPMIEPCVCDSDNIICSGDVDLKHIFHALSRNTENKSDKHFENFTLENATISRMDENTFHEITFRRVTLKNCTNLKHIQSHTFSTTASTIEEFSQLDSSQLGERRYSGDFSEAISSLVNVSKLTFEYNNWRNIKSKFFRNIFGVQKHLTEIDFNPNRLMLKQIQTIGHQAFYYLPNLQTLNFYGHRINRINWGSFNFFKPSNETLEIDLSSNDLTATSFQRYSTKHVNRPLSLNLTNNTIEYLNEKVFSTFFKENKQNKLNLVSDGYNCDCRWFWIFKSKQELSYQLNDIVCDNGITIWNQTQQYFDDC